jgi:hypothetical protein
VLKTIDSCTVGAQWISVEISETEPLAETKCASHPCSTWRFASDDHPSSSYELNHGRRSRHFSGEQLAPRNVYFRFVSNPTRIDGKCGDHFLQANFSLLIRPTSSNPVSSPQRAIVRLSWQRKPDISNNVGPVKHFLSRLIHLLKRVFSSASWVVFLVGLDDFGSLVI